MSNVYVHFSQISFPARYLVVNFQLESHSLRFREVMIYVFSLILSCPGKKVNGKRPSRDAAALGFSVTFAHKKHLAESKAELLLLLTFTQVTVFVKSTTPLQATGRQTCSAAEQRGI